ncbi:hypothetical protein AB0D27_43365 [Streptomyces sp. NPDC048415]|uniref:hypothetical protein n=1 Tax=Streptomyces sp. NPDC048415 TaxID=3154822 RepID=UPI00341DA708
MPQFSGRFMAAKTGESRNARSRLAWLVAGLMRRPGTMPYRQAVPDGPHEALATLLDDGRVIVVAQPTGAAASTLVSYDAEMPSPRGPGASPALAGG